MSLSPSPRGFPRSSEFIPRFGLPRKQWWFDDAAHRASVRANQPHKERITRALSSMEIERRKILDDI